MMLRLRDNLSAYDALYVTLAEALRESLVAGDRKLDAVPRMSVRVEPV